MDLVYLLANRFYEGVEKPSEIYYTKHVKDTRSARAIVNDVVKKLTG